MGCIRVETIIDYLAGRYKSTYTTKTLRAQDCRHMGKLLQEAIL
jgi:hypothetical protein